MGRIVNILTIAGLDPSGGAGVVADVKAISAQGAYACAVVAALTAQNTQTVTGIYPVSSACVLEQIDTLLADVSIDAVKIGMLGDQDMVRAVGQRLARATVGHVVLDPVMVSTGGQALLADDALEVLRTVLLPVATVLTPNAPEAGALLGRKAPTNLADMREAARDLHALMAKSGSRWVYVKGGHIYEGDHVVDVLYDGSTMRALSGPRIVTQNTHGTGCTLSAALAAWLPQVPTVPEAARHAKDYLTAALARADELSVGCGHGPVCHFPAGWKKST